MQCQLQVLSQTPAVWSVINFCLVNSEIDGLSVLSGLWKQIENDFTPSKVK